MMSPPVGRLRPVPRPSPCPVPTSERGIGLVITLLILAIVSALGSTIIVGNMADLQISNNYSHRSTAFYAADSGIEATIRDLRQDQTWILRFVNQQTWTLNDPLPTDVVVNGQAIVAGAGDGYSYFGGWEQLGDGSYRRMILTPPTVNLVAGDGVIAFAVRSDGQGGDIDLSSQNVRANIELDIAGYGVWDNAVFGGDGQAGNTINGNVAIRGSMHVVGDPNNPGTVAFSGTADVRNNYGDAVSQFGATDAARLPALGLVEHNGEMVQSLESIVRAKHVNITMDGTADIGNPDVTGNGYKETVDSMRSDGTVTPPSQVYADDWDSYDAGDLQFPTLDDPYIASDGSYWSTHRDFLQTRSLEISEPKIGPGVASFSYADANGNSISWDGPNQVLQIQGIVRVNGNLQLGTLGGQYLNRGFMYEGTGTLYADGDIEIDGPIVPNGNYLGDGNLGLIADQDVEIDHTAQINVFAAVYAEDNVSITKQTTLAGSVVSRTFDLGNNVPAIFQVPSLSTNLPPGMPGNMRIGVIEGARVAGWYQER